MRAEDAQTAAGGGFSVVFSSHGFEHQRASQAWSYYQSDNEDGWVEQEQQEGLPMMMKREL